MSDTSRPFGIEPPGADYACHPYPALMHLANSSPRHYAAERDAWFFSARADITALLRDDRLVIAPGSTFTDRTDPFRATVARRLRAWFAACEPLLAETISAVIENCLSTLIKRERGDLVCEVAQAIPSQVMAVILGIRAGDLPVLRQIADSLLGAYDLDWPGRTASSSFAAPQLLAQYFQEHWRVAPPTVLMELLRATQQEFGLPRASMADTCSKLFTAGTTTTGACIANILARLLGEAASPIPAEASATADDFLRMDAPILGIKRVARAHVLCGDAVIRPGQKVYLLTGSANRLCGDEQSGSSLTFGQGRYRCLGSTLAQLEISALLNSFQAILPRVRLSGPVLWRESWLLHEARSIPVTIDGVFDANRISANIDRVL